MCSSASAAISHEMQQDFGVSPTISRLPVAMFLFGFALGPVVLTPLAEVSRIMIGSPHRLNIPFQDYGRKKVLAACLALFCALRSPRDSLCQLTQRVFSQMCVRYHAHWLGISQ